MIIIIYSRLASAAMSTFLFYCMEFPVSRVCVEHILQARHRINFVLFSRFVQPEFLCESCVAIRESSNDDRFADYKKKCKNIQHVDLLCFAV